MWHILLHALQVKELNQDVNVVLFDGNTFASRREAKQ